MASERKIGMVELVTAIGDDDIKFQNIAADLANVQATKHGTKLTFFTDPSFISPNTVMYGNGEYVGLVLWLPKAKVDAVLHPAINCQNSDSNSERGK